MIYERQRTASRPIHTAGFEAVSASFRPKREITPVAGTHHQVHGPFWAWLLSGEGVASIIVLMSGFVAGLV